MADKTALQAGEETAENEIGQGATAPDQGIFDANFSAIMDPFGQACEQQGVTLALAIALPKDGTKPVVFVRGHPFDVTALAVKVIKNLQDQLMQALNGD